MIELIIPAIITVAIMFCFSFFIFRNAIKRINNTIKKYFIDKLQDYNYLIEEKEEKIRQLREELEEEKRKITIAKDMQEVEENRFSSDIEEKLKKMKQYSKKPTKESRNGQIVYNIPTPQYREENFFKSYKELKEKFSVNNENTIKEFINKNKDNTDKA